MSLQESYGFDAFCQELIQQWPAVSLSFRRTDNRLFVTAASLGVLATAVSHDAELAGSTVRRAVADLHARLVVRAPTGGVTLKPIVPAVNAAEARVLALAKELVELNEQIETLNDRGEALGDALNAYLEEGEPDLLEGAIEAGKELPLIPGKLNALQARADEVEKLLNELDPDGEIESVLADSGRL